MPIRRISEELATSVQTLPPGPVCVAFSGGLDSAVLLHALAGMAAIRERGLRAVHVNHRLQTQASQWPAHCAAIAKTLDVAFVDLAVDVLRQPGAGLGADARRARYSAITAVLQPDEILALAHHRDDQAETVLLKLMRGAGPEGLGAMPPLRQFGESLFWRPLLDIPRAMLHEYAEHHRLAWISDPSNADTTLDRNYLRLEVMPSLRRRWPEAEASIAQSARWARAAAAYIDTQTQRALACIRAPDPFTLYVQEWLELPEALRDPVLRFWLRSIDLPEPTWFQVDELERQLRHAGEDRQPCVRWRGAELRRYRDLLYAMPQLELPPLAWSSPFDGHMVELPANCGVLRCLSRRQGRNGTQPQLPDGWQLRFRRGGERLKLAQDAATRELRELFQDAGIPSWERRRLPLLFMPDGALAAVSDLWISADAQRIMARHDCRLEWSPASAAGPT